MVNNDGDVTTTVRIADIIVEAAEVTPPGGVTPALTALTATEAIDFESLADVSGSFVAEYQRTSFNEETDVLYVDVAVSNQGQYLADVPLIVVVDRISDPSVRVLDADGLTPEGLPYYDFTNLVNDGTLDPDEVTGSRTISFRNPDGVQFDYDLTFLGNLNQIPEFVSEPDTEAIAGKEYIYDADAVDPDGDNLTYTLLVAPEGMTIDSETGEISWSPQVEDIGNQNVVVRVSDGRAGVAEQNFTLSAIAAPPNRPPLITSVPVVDANVGSEYSYQVVATDPDGENLTYSLAQAPEGVSIGETGFIEWIPNGEQVGVQDVIVEVTDEQGATATQSYEILVGQAIGNNGPVIISEPVTQININTDYQYKVNALDPDEDILSYELVNAPDGMTINSNTGDISLNSTEEDLGFYDVTVRVDDGRGGIDTQSFMVEIVNPFSGGIQGSKFNDLNANGFKDSDFTVLVTDDSSTVDNNGVFRYDGNTGEFIDLFVGEFLTDNNDRGYQPEDDIGYSAQGITIGPDNNLYVGYKITRNVIRYDGTTGEFIDIFVPGNITNSPFLPDGLAFGPDGNFYVADNNSGNSRVQRYDGTTGDFIDTVISQGGRFGINSLTFGPDGNLYVTNRRVGILKYDLATQEVSQFADLVVVANPTGLFQSFIRGLDFGPDGNLYVADQVADSILRYNGQTGEFIDVFAQEPLLDPEDPEFGPDGNLYVSDGGSDRVVRFNGATGEFIDEFVPAGEGGLGSPRRLTITSTDLEPGLEGWVIYLDQNRNGRRDGGELFTITDEQGNYSFPNLAPGTYFVAEEIQPGWLQTAPSDSTYEITIEDEEIVQGIDFGNVEDISGENRAPEFTSTPPNTAVAGELFRYDAVALDPDGDPLTYELVTKPFGMTVDPTTGTVVWEAQDGITAGALLRVSDGKGGVALQGLNINVPITFTPPVITSTPLELATADLPYQYQVVAQDARNTKLSFQLESAPIGMVIDEASGLLTWTSTVDQIGSNEVTITAGIPLGLETSQTFTLEVVADSVNDPPVILSSPRETINLGGIYRYQLEASDPNSDPLTTNLALAPIGMTVDELGYITWEPTAGQFGINEVQIQIEDGRGGIATQEFTIDVVSQVTNEVPDITSNPKLFANSNLQYSYDVKAIDADGDPLIWSLLTSPTGMSIDSQRGTVRWTPTLEQVGIHEVKIEVIDAQGGFATQSFTLEVRGVNTPPQISSIPPTTAVANESYTYAIEANDLDGDPLTFSFLTAPAGMNINANTREIQWIPNNSQLGEQQVEILVSDSRGGQIVQGYTIFVQEVVPNQRPTIDSQPTFLADITSTYSYQVEANDPDGDPLTYRLLDAPSGMNIDENTGLIEWNPDSSQLGEAKVSVAVFDPSGLGAVQTYDLRVQPANNAPTITSTPVESAVPETTYRYDVGANDPDGEPRTYSLTQAPEGMEIDELGRISWTPNPDDLGSYDIEVAVTDSRGATTTQSYQLTVAADTQAPLVNLTLDNDRANIGDEVTFQVSATDNVGVEELRLTFNGENIALDGNGRATVQIDSAGTFEAIASAIDAAGNIGSDTTTVFGINPSDVDAPVVSFTNLTEPVEITSPLDIIGTVTDDNLQSYTLEIAPVGSNNFTEIASGTDPVTDGFLGQLDPAILTNDTYTLRLFAQDTGGNESVVETQVSVLGELKLGDFELSFTDLTVPVSGIPITLARTYNSQNANRQDDFGFGWRLEIADTDLRTSVAQTGSEELGINNPYFDGARVYVTLPGESRQGFTFNPQPAPGVKGSFLGIWEPVFVPDAGVTSTLSVEQFDLQRTDTGEFFSYSSSLAYNPSSPVFGGTFTLTTKEGIAYEIDGITGDARTISDRNGNVLSFTDAGIISSSGQQITFERNPQGQITAAIDPMGMRIEYEYDANGDLVAVTDREGNVTQFEYNQGRPHFLEEIIDPLNRTGARSEYDVQGRLVKIIDADGEAVELIHNPNNFVETVRDQLDNPTTFVYDNRGNIITEIDAEGGITERTYDTNNNTLTEKVFDGINPEGNTTTFTYDARGNVLTETDPLGNVTRFTYDSFGNVLTTTDAQGNTTTNTYDANGNLTSISGQANGTTTLSYDASGNLTSFGDAAGTTFFEYDSFGNVTRQVDAEKNETTFTYDANGNQLIETRTLTTSDGVRTLVTINEYDAEGRVIKVTDPEEGVTETIYDAVGNVVEEIDAKKRSTKFKYDDRGLLVETIYPDNTPDQEDLDNPRIITEYDAAGRVTAEIDELERKTVFEYDLVGRVTKTILPDDTPNDDTDNPFTETKYDDAGRVKEEIDERGNSTKFVYDKAGRQIETILPDDTPDDDSDNPIFTTSYDEAGRQKTQTDALGNVTEFFYDDLGRPTGQEFADGTTVSSEFDEVGRLIARTDQDGEVTRFEYDALGRLTAVIDALEQRTEYGYDEQGNLITQKDAKGNIAKFEYDGLARRIATELPEGQRSTSEYDTLRNVISTTDFNGETITYEYDERNRLTAKNFPDGSSTTYTYTLTGQRETVVDARGTTIYEYDAQERLTKRIDPDGREIAYTYDAAGNRTSVDIPSAATDYTFDELNRLKTVTDAEGGVTTYFYNDNSNLIGTEFPNGTVETRQYDNLNRLTYIETKDVNGDIISSFLYELNAEGNRTQVTEHDGRIVKYSYDDLDRLEKEEIFDPGATAATRTIEYAYDEVGNRLSRVDSGEGTTIYTYDNNDRLSTETTDGVETTYTYDDNGNTISKTTGGETVTYEWDAEKRLVGADTDGDGTVDVTNQYDADGVRVAQTVNGEETRFLIDTNRPFVQVLEEYTPGGIIKVSYVYGNDLISQDRNGERSFYHVDGLGSTRALSNASGLATDRYIYDAFGQVLTKIGDTENSYLYAGEQRDSNLGLDYLRARYLDVGTGRFINRDIFPPIIVRPISLHRFLYADANPVSNIDPSGKVTLGAVLLTASLVGTAAAILDTTVRANCQGKDFSFGRFARTFAIASTIVITLPVIAGLITTSSVLGASAVIGFIASLSELFNDSFDEDFQCLSESNLGLSKTFTDSVQRAKDKIEESR